MQLHKHGTSILASRPGRAPILLERIDPRRAEAVLLAQGHSAAVAREVSHGALSSAAAVRLGRLAGLLTGETR